jgi:hypothetical protein
MLEDDLRIDELQSRRYGGIDDVHLSKAGHRMFLQTTSNLALCRLLDLRRTLDVVEVKNTRH